MSLLYNATKSTDYCFGEQDQQDQRKWFIFYVRPKAEKKVFQDLKINNHETFLPTIKALKIWKNRQKKWIESPLFPGYIFVKTINSSLYHISLLPNIVTYIKCGKLPSVIRNEDIQAIKKVLGLNQDVYLDHDFHEGQKVRIINGPLMGHDGIIVTKNGRKRFGVQLKEINYTVYIDVYENILERI